jgi:Ser/Thr protein kinase RdoA (MazF antagonist)
MSLEELAARTARAVDAAAAAGRAAGLEVTDPQVRYDVFSVIVELVPSPVVVRVPTVLPGALDRAAQRAQQVREVAVTSWLAGTGHPVVVPAPQVPDQPVEHDGFSMTCWTLVDVLAAPQAPPETRAEQTGRQIAALHAALAPCPVELAFMVPLDATIPAMLDQLRDRPDLLDPDDLARARREWDALAPVLTSPAGLAARFPDAVVQPVHGDSPAHNVLHTPDGPLDSDFEHVTVGPVEWDLVSCGPEAVAAYEAAAGHAVDRDLLAVVEASRMVQLAACFAMVPELPMLAEGMRPLLEQWRTTPEAGDLLG